MNWDRTCPLNSAPEVFSCDLCGRVFFKEYQLRIHETTAAGSLACR